MIDKAELRTLLQSTDGGRERVTKHKVGKAMRRAGGVMPLCCSLLNGVWCILQDWLTERDVQKWLNKFDWDGSGDIDYLEFEALVSRLTHSNKAILLGVLKHA